MKADADVRAYAKGMRRAMTRAETILWTRLRRRQVLGVVFRRQLPIGRAIVDFACAKAKLVVEVDGPTHGSDLARWEDAVRTAEIETRGWRVVRVWNSEVDENEDGVVEMIEARVREGLGL